MRTERKKPRPTSKAGRGSGAPGEPATSLFVLPLGLLLIRAGYVRA